jgi:ribonuclease R
MGKRLRKPIKRERFLWKIIKYYRKVLIKHSIITNKKLELDDTESRNQIIKDLKILASK